MADRIIIAFRELVEFQYFFHARLFIIVAICIHPILIHVVNTLSSTKVCCKIEVTKNCKDESSECILCVFHCDNCIERKIKLDLSDQVK